MLSIGSKSSGLRAAFENWAGTVQCTPEEVVYPTSIEEVVSLVKRCNEQQRRVRVVGSGHSFTPLVQTTDILVSLDKLSGLVEVNEDKHTAVVWAGTKLKDLGNLLHEKGLAQENLGDIDVQSIAGAISTGTHGTGIHFGTLSTQVIGITAVLGNGEVVKCSDEQHPNLFKALQVSFGSLGILVQVELQLVPRFRMKYSTYRMKLDDCLAQLELFRAHNRHFEFYCFPYSRDVQVKFMNKTDDPETEHGFREYFSKIILENRVFWVLSELCLRFPGLTKSVSRLSAKSVPVFEEVEYSHNLFATPRLVRFTEMEYNVPLECMTAVIREVLACIESQRIKVHFPIECRFVRGDNIWLSPANGRDSAYIAVHMYRGMPYDAYFRAVEEIFVRYGGRPHWGKMNTRDGEDFRRMYPKWDDFCEVRRFSDPNGIFLNSYLEGLFSRASMTATKDVASSILLSAAPIPEAGEGASM